MPPAVEKTAAAHQQGQGQRARTECFLRAARALGASRASQAGGVALRSDRWRPLGLTASRRQTTLGGMGADDGMALAETLSCPILCGLVGKRKENPALNAPRLSLTASLSPPPSRLLPLTLPIPACFSPPVSPRLPLTVSLSPPPSHRLPLASSLLCLAAVSHRLFLTACVSPPVSHRLCLTACFSPPVSHRLCLTACVSPPVSHRLFLTACFSPPVSHRLFLTACASPPVSRRLFLTATPAAACTSSEEQRRPTKPPSPLFPLLYSMFNRS
eukprot:1187630-Prorocentrum_minimum.AAC.2